MPVDRRSFLGGLAALAVGGGIAARETQVIDLVNGQAPTSTPWCGGPRQFNVTAERAEDLIWSDLGDARRAELDAAYGAAWRGAIRRCNENFEDGLING